MKLKDNVQIDILKKYGFQLVEHNQETGFKRYTKHYGSFLVTVCNNRLENHIHLSLQENVQSSFEGKRIIACIHQINKDLCLMASRGLIEFLEDTNDVNEEEAIEPKYSGVNNWEEQIAKSNPFAFLMK